ncbi:hypothetical protein Poly24_34360 [Rosistilla carotiformis]|uniref:Carboxypeptidase regulatory-like domain-containing protein n=1 Tax=Rosistilla carotiformis TaxID=2528017 RepID=A0A518JW03_9BACT|nr:hypothetical protein [Rosistilla carotiformis]QDV69719.1 hypothetical protein Poly24_34360 [Rosistilla carotiformis]
MHRYAHFQPDGPPSWRPTLIPRTTATIAIGLCLAALLGCEARIPLVPVTGTVTIDGEPLPMGSIMVAPASGPVAYGTIDREGRFTLQTRDGEGCVVGTHPVSITASEMVQGGAAIRRLVPERYSDFASSELSIEVTDPTPEVRIELTSEGLSERLLSNEGDLQF